VECSPVECSHVQSSATKPVRGKLLLILLASLQRRNIPHPLYVLCLLPILCLPPVLAGLWPYGRAHGTTAAALPAPACELTKSSICLRSSAFGSRCTEERGKLVSGDVWLIWSQCRIAGRS